MVICLAPTSRHVPSACCTVACSGVRSSRPRIALQRDPAIGFDYLASANSTITIAASGQWPINMAPVTAIDMRAFILRLRFLSAIHPFL